MRPKKLISQTKQNNPLVGDKNGMFGKKWICNRTTGECQVIYNNDEVPNGWEEGHIDFVSKESREKTNKNLKNVSGMIKAYNPISNEIHYYKTENEIPDGFVRGCPKLTDETRKKISERTLEAMWKNRDYDAVVNYYKNLYEIYKKEGFDGVLKVGYTKSQPNLIQLFKRYIPDFKPQRGKKRGTI